jgi:hypothetical protein
MKMEAFPCASRYIEGNAKIRNAVSHHGITHANKPRKPARQPETSAAIKQTDRQVKPTLKGQVRTQNRASASEEIPARVFESVEAWQAYLESKG